jgi:hypothetical protein
MFILLCIFLTDKYFYMNSQQKDLKIFKLFVNKNSIILLYVAKYGI